MDTFRKSIPTAVEGGVHSWLWPLKRQGIGAAQWQSRTSDYESVTKGRQWIPIRTFMGRSTKRTSPRRWGWRQPACRKPLGLRMSSKSGGLVKERGLLKRGMRLGSRPRWDEGFHGRTQRIPTIQSNACRRAGRAPLCRGRSFGSVASRALTMVRRP